MYTDNDIHISKLATKKKRHSHMYLIRNTSFVQFLLYKIKLTKIVKRSPNTKRNECKSYIQQVGKKKPLLMIDNLCSAYSLSIVMHRRDINDQQHIQKLGCIPCSTSYIRHLQIWKYEVHMQKPYVCKCFKRYTEVLYGLSYI